MHNKLRVVSNKNWRKSAKKTVNRESTHTNEKVGNVGAYIFTRPSAAPRRHHPLGTLEKRENWASSFARAAWTDVSFEIWQNHVYAEFSLLLHKNVQNECAENLHKMPDYAPEYLYLWAPAWQCSTSTYCSWGARATFWFDTKLCQLVKIVMLLHVCFPAAWLEIRDTAAKNTYAKNGLTVYEVRQLKQQQVQYY